MYMIGDEDLSEYGIPYKFEFQGDKRYYIGRCEPDGLKKNEIWSPLQPLSPVIGPVISRTHCCIYWNRADWVLVNLAMNAMLLNGQPVPKCSRAMHDNYSERALEFAKLTHPRTHEHQKKSGNGDDVSVFSWEGATADVLQAIWQHQQHHTVLRDGDKITVVRDITGQEFCTYTCRLPKPGSLAPFS